LRGNIQSRDGNHLEAN